MGRFLPIKTWRSALRQFAYKDYRQDNQQKVILLSADEFIRRFCSRATDSFHRIRYYGFLGNRYRQEKLERCRENNRLFA